MSGTQDALPQPPVVFLLGATATGKTAIALELAQRFPVEIISVDSALIYRMMDIGTAKPDEQERRSVPHHLIDIIDPWESYSVAAFIEDARAAIEQVRTKQKIPLLTGGTMMYFNALEYGLTEMPAADEKLRAMLDDKLKSQGLEALHDELKQVDPASAERIHPNDPQRILRALEVWHASGRSLSDWHRQKTPEQDLKALKFGLFPQRREQLHEQIERRFRQMLEDGLLDEVAFLRNLPRMSRDLPSMRSVGYRQVWDYLDGYCDYESMIDKAIAATRQLAKRQITWMRKMQNLERYDTGELLPKDIVDNISRELTSYPGH
ncbi:MAG: tRNA (adenosine(37)-N6)-dimethylallyltransferase MiaA [Gammaproteobacteria bacterium]|nr:tRNA (adenosine(37)-N6)-dimethylallyltransferase MiaA [Gammaproteobacteria bacterium]